jgi:hypothetical protein
MISGKIKNLSSLEKVVEKLDDVDSNLYAYKITLVVAIQQAVEAELKNLLGEGFKHFSVSVSSNGMNPTVSVKFIDDVGKFLYYGTQSHNINSSTPMPVGSGMFRYGVSHPGIKSKKEEINQAIGRGVLIGKAAIGKMGGRL